MPPRRARPQSHNPEKRDRDRLEQFVGVGLTETVRHGSDSKGCDELATTDSSTLFAKSSGTIPAIVVDAAIYGRWGGSFHLTPSQAYDIADNGNDSRIHWDLVLIQRPDYGGGEISFDGELLRTDGNFLPADLQGLNVGL